MGDGREGGGRADRTGVVTGGVVGCKEEKTDLSTASLWINPSRCNGQKENCDSRYTKWQSGACNRLYQWCVGWSLGFLCHATCRCHQDQYAVAFQGSTQPEASACLHLSGIFSDPSPHHLEPSLSVVLLKSETEIVSLAIQLPF